MILSLGKYLHPQEPIKMGVNQNDSIYQKYTDKPWTKLSMSVCIVITVSKRETKKMCGIKRHREYVVEWEGMRLRKKVTEDMCSWERETEEFKSKKETVRMYESKVVINETKSMCE